MKEEKEYFYIDSNGRDGVVLDDVSVFYRLILHFFISLVIILIIFILCFVFIKSIVASFLLFFTLLFLFIWYSPKEYWALSSVKIIHSDTYKVSMANNKMKIYRDIDIGRFKYIRISSVAGKAPFAVAILVGDKSEVILKTLEIDSSKYDAHEKITQWCRPIASWLNIDITNNIW